MSITVCCGVYTPLYFLFCSLALNVCVAFLFEFHRRILRLERQLDRPTILRSIVVITITINKHIHKRSKTATSCSSGGRVDDSSRQKQVESFKKSSYYYYIAFYSIIHSFFVNEKIKSILRL